MKKIFIIIVLLILNNCAGYKPIFSSKDVNFYIGEITIKEDNKLIRNIVKNLKPYTIQNDKRKINLELNLDIKEAITLKDSKGNTVSEEMGIALEVKTILENNDQIKFNFSEKFTFNNQSNKFELNQYKKRMQINLVEKIYQDLIIRLGSL
tara:strand:- start:2071 stop:2523 length:453 start_codon:yes stop_codon:yes gene_type:complete